MMVDDDDIGFRGAGSHLGHEAVVEARTLGPDAVLARRGDVGPERQVLGQVFHFGAVARLGVARPLVDQLDDAGVLARVDRGALLQRVEAVEAQVVPASFHIGRGERHAKRLAQDGEILEVDLLLEVLRAGGNEDALPAENRRNQVRERLSCARAGFGEQNAALVEDVGNGGRHFKLRGARLEAVERGGERAAGREDRRYASG